MKPLFGEDSALLVIDVQNDFAHPDGSLYVSGSEQAVARIGEIIKEAQLTDTPIIYTADCHPEETPHFAKDGGLWPTHCIAGSWGAQFVDELVVDGPIVRKGVDGGDGYSGFSVMDPTSGKVAETDLDGILDQLGTKHLVIVGIATDVCVASTVEDALGLGFSVRVLADATAGVELNDGDIESALERLKAGAVITGEVPR